MNEKAKILVVEDEGIVAEDIQLILVSLDYEVMAIASSGQVALSKVEEMQPDLILMDIVLQGEYDGIETTEMIQARFDIPVIYLTAYADPKTIEKAKKTEPYGYLLKPFENRELHITVEMALYKHRMEKKLQEREAYFSTTLKSITNGVITTDNDLKVTFMNPIAEKITGWKFEEIQKKSLNKILHFINEDTGKRIDNQVEKVIEEGISISLVNPAFLVTKNRSNIPVTNNCSPIINDKGAIIGAVIIIEDVTEKRHVEKERERMREQLLQAQKMEAIGKLAGGIAHDFNTLLTVMQGFTDMAMMNLKESEASYADLEQVRLAATTAADLTRQLLIFSRKHPMTPTPLLLNDPIINLLKILKRLIGEDIEIKTELDPNLWTMKADRTTLEQIILNLAVNAREAMPKGGILTIKTENVIFDESHIDRFKEARPGKYVCLSVSDTGVGMDKEILDHIFEPFFSRKGPGKGTGLGLSVVYGIVQEHLGWIGVDSKPRKGTTFNTYFPANSEIRPDKKKSNMEPYKHATGSERILIVEDQKGAREFTYRALKRAGYEVFAASNASEAIELFKNENGNFDLVISDVELPDTTGIELVDELLSIKPELRILMCSGYTDQKSRWPLIRQRGYQFLKKPFGYNDLLNSVKQTLNTEQA